MRRLLLLALLLSLNGPGVAQAGWKIDRALAIANKAWHSPCDGQTRVAWGTDISSVRAWSWQNPCLIVLNSAVDWPWEWLCTDMLHEMGHVAGFPHSTNPKSVMYPVGDYGEDIILSNKRRVRTYTPANWRCHNRGRTYLGRYRLSD